MSDNQLPEGVTTSTLDGEYPHTTYRLGDTVMHDSDGLEGRHAVVRVSPEQLPHLLAVLTDLHRPASRAHLQVVPE